MVKRAKQNSKIAAQTQGAEFSAEPNLENEEEQVKSAEAAEDNNKAQQVEIAEASKTENLEDDNLSEIVQGEKEIESEAEKTNEAEDLEKQIVEQKYQEIAKQESSEDKNIGLSSEIVEEKMKQALERQSPKKRRKSTIINLCLLLVNIVFMIFIVKKFMGDVGELSFSEIINSQGGKLWWLAGGIGIYLLYIFAQTLMYKVLIKDLTGKSRWGLAYDVAIVGKYYDNVTPFAVGGQPMQIVRLATHKISAGVSTSIPIIKMVINNTVNLLLALGFFIFALPRIPLTTPLNDILLILLEILGVIGLIITLIVVVFMLLISSGSLFTRSFISGILRIGYKLKLVKNYRQALKKTLNQVSEYRTSMSYLIKHKLLLFKMLVLCIVECLSYAVMPYFVVMAFATPEALTSMSPALLFFVCVAKYYICAMASSFIPLPGGTGLMEISFIFLFWPMVGNNIVWTLLIWRSLSYYLVIAHGFIHELIQIIVNISKSKSRLNEKH